MLGHGAEHVVEEPDAGVDVVLACGQQVSQAVSFLDPSAPFVAES